MASPNSIHSRVIAVRLKRIRAEAGLTGDDAAGKLGWSPSKMSRIERCKNPLSFRDLHDMLSLYQVGTAVREEIEAVAHRLRGRPLDDYAEAAATLQWTVTVLPELVRTPAYARAVLDAAQPLTRRTGSEISLAVRDVASRRARLLSDAGEQSLRLCLDEAVLLRPYGTRAEMAGQLAGLHKMAAHPGIAIRMLPLERAVLRPPTFSLFCFTAAPDPDLPPAAVIDHGDEDWVSGSEGEAFRYQLMFEHLWGLAADEEATRAAIGKVAAVMART